MYMKRLIFVTLQVEVLLIALFEPANEKNLNKESFDFLP